MARATVDPVEKQTGREETTTTHPAFAQIPVSRLQTTETVAERVSRLLDVVRHASDTDKVVVARAEIMQLVGMEMGGDLVVRAECGVAFAKTPLPLLEDE